jgi:hypothetical protein
MTVIVFEARPEKKMNGKGIIEWYTNHGYLGDFLEAYASDGKMIYNEKTRLYEIHFTPNKLWPKTLQEQTEEADIYLSNPDSNGNYPIDGYVVVGQLRFIDGHKVIW